MTFAEKKASLVPNSAEYQRVHRWVVKHLGKADGCSECYTKTAKKYEWSNISKDYKRELSDWKKLCTSCHRKYDGITQDGLRRLSIFNSIKKIGNTNHNTPIVSICKNTGVITYWESLKEASTSLGILRSSISNCLREDTKTAGMHYWHYARKRG